MLAIGAGLMIDLCTAQVTYTVEQGGFSNISGTGTYTDINAAGAAAGYLFYPIDATGAQVAVHHPSSGPVVIGRFGNQGNSRANAINGAGIIVGNSYQPATGTTRAFYFDGALHEFGPAGGLYSSASDINDSGVIVGSAWFVAEVQATQGFRYESGNLVNLGTLGGLGSGANAINATGTIAGSAQLSDGAWRAFSYNNGVMSNLGALAGTNSYASGINGSGHIVGRADIDMANTFHATLYRDGQVIDLGTLGGATSTAQAINDDGAIVGYSLVDAGSTPHAFIYQDGQMIDLNSLVDLSATSFDYLSHAFGINDLGQIVGQGVLRNSNYTAPFILTPFVAVPEPSTYALLAGLAALLLACRIRSRNGTIT